MRNLLFFLSILFFGCQTVEKGDALVISTEGSTGGTAECAPGLSSCDGACVYTEFSVQHCGGCGVACGSTEVCVEGQCSQAPDDCRVGGATCPARHFCEESTGRCTFGCTSNADCPTGSTCDIENHLCNCDDAETTLCGAACVDQSPSSCGDPCEACSYPPNSVPTCDEGSCAFECVDGARMCDGSCALCPTSGVDSTTCDGASCVVSECEDGFALCDGNCSKCPAGTAPADQGCDGSQCVSKDCGAGKRWCGACVECPSDPNGVAQCDGSQCVTVCDPGFHECGGRCVSEDDASACGSSCEQCAQADYGTAVCMAGACTQECDADARMCNGACSPCPTQGVTDVRCSSGACVALSCEGGWTKCGDKCCTAPPTGTIRSNVSGFQLSIAVDSFGNPAYLLGDYSSAKYTVWNGASWLVHNLGAAPHGDALITEDGVHHLCVSAGGALEYRKLDGSTWTTVPISSTPYASACRIWKIDGKLVITAYRDGPALAAVQSSAGWDVNSLSEGGIPLPLSTSRFAQIAADPGFRGYTIVIATDTATNAVDELGFSGLSNFGHLTSDMNGGLVGVLEDSRMVRFSDWATLQQRNPAITNAQVHQHVERIRRHAGADHVALSDRDRVLVKRVNSSSTMLLSEQVVTNGTYSVDAIASASSVVHVMWLMSDGSVEYRRVQ